MKFESTEVWGFEHSLRGMRNPKNSWDKSDSEYWLPNMYMNENVCGEDVDWTPYHIGQNDMKLAQTLIKGGNEHRKFLRQIFASVDITAPLYWWKEFDTYKIGVTANSTSTMHKLTSAPITLKCFETDDYDRNLTLTDQGCGLDPISIFEEDVILVLDNLRLRYLETKDKRYWKELIRWLPESWLQTRTITMSYENVRNMYFQRRNHKLTEWSKSFIEWVKTLPYAEKLIMYEK